MVTERIQRQIDGLLDEADAAARSGEWETLREVANRVLTLDPDNEDAKAFEAAAGRASAGSSKAISKPTGDENASPGSDVQRAPAAPASFGAGRYRVQRFLGEGGRKRVFLAHDTRLDREVAFCSIRTDGLDTLGRQRVLHEAQSMGRLGAHPHLVAIHDFGEEDGKPYIVQEFVPGGDLGDAIEKADDHRLPLERTLAIAKDVCRGLAFIHQGGTVHRDLKPGNVFIGADGTAKIGDFGLAVALDRSRLTQHGMMLGTVSYMPPEQALGGEATPRSDLYSLGAMLYEMVTGRRPFLGDDPTAVISQHINTPPVAPSWLTERCPPPLEDLILRLLEKDPGKRPASANETLAAIEAIDPTQRSASHSDSNVLDRLARGVFVGREKELERLRKAFDEAFAGHGSLVMLVGEPGIGKTRTTQELETYARIRGAAVLWGASHESSGAPPFYPWVQLGRQWGVSGDPQLLTRAMAAGNWELARLFPELRQLPAFVEPPAAGDPASAQFLLFDAYTAFIRAISEGQPLVVMLDDVHWADKPTLLLLQQLARGLANMRVLVVCTYRDTDLSRTHPLSEALGTLNRESGFLRIPLRGLSRAEVEGYIRAAANISPPARVVDRIFEETEGNPFFLSEVVNLMTQEGTLTRASVSDIAVPDGVREALGRRLDRISEEANELLQVCAVAGREFSYDTLTLLGERDEDTLLKLIEEAIEARVIEEMEQPGRYRFTHALMQETLLEELSTTRRVRLHGQVGEALEKRWGARADERASRLAEHFVEAAMLTPRHAHKAVHYAKLAAQQAEAQTGWPEAAQWYEKALTLVTEAEDGLGEDEAQLLLRLGVCYRYASSFRAAWRSLMRAITLFRERGDGVSLARATLEAIDMNPGAERVRALLDQAIEMVGDAAPRVRAMLLIRRAMDQLELGDAHLVGVERAAADSEARLAEARRLAAAQDWPEVDGELLMSEARQRSDAGDFAGARQSYSTAFELLVRAGDPSRAALTLTFICETYTSEGLLDEALEACERALAFSRANHVSPQIATAATMAATIRLARCEMDAFDAFEAVVAIGGNEWMEMVRAKRLVQEGRLNEALARSPEIGANIRWIFRPQVRAELIRVLHFLGDDRQGRDQMQVWREEFEEVPGPLFRVLACCELDEALFALGSQEDVEMVANTLASLPARFTQAGGHCVDRYRGDVALHLGRVDDAERWYSEGLAWCERERCPVEAGRCHMGLAEIAARQGDTGAALDHLGKAANWIRPTGAKLYLDQVIARKVDLQGIGSQPAALGDSIDAVRAAVETEKPDLSRQAAPDGTVTLMFSDIEDSTPLNEQLGDPGWMEVLRLHNAVIRRQINAHGGYEVKTMGDAFMVAFASAVRALECAIAIQADFEGATSASAEDGPTTQIRVRMGLHTGEVVREGEDFYGIHVTLAARIAAQAQGGEILVSELLRDLVAPGRQFSFDEGRDLTLKGLAGTHRAFRVRAWPV